MISLLLPKGPFFETLLPAIEETLAGAGHDFSRHATDFTSTASLTQLHAAIQASDLVLAEVTGHNPAILYGIGLAHAWSKRVVFLTRRLEHFPFDPEAHEVVVHAGDPELLRADLARLLGRVPAAAANMDGLQETDPARYQFHQWFGDLMQAHGKNHTGGIRLEDPTTLVLEEQDLPLGLIQQMSNRARSLGVRLKFL